MANPSGRGSFVPYGGNYHPRGPPVRNPHIGGLNPNIPNPYGNRSFRQEFRQPMRGHPPLRGSYPESHGNDFRNQQNTSEGPNNSNIMHYLDVLDEEQFQAIYNLSQRTKEELARAEGEKRKIASEVRNTEVKTDSSNSKVERELARHHFKVIRFMFESGLKLKMKAIPMASAANVYHRFFQECSLNDYDPYLIATTALYIGHKLEEDFVKIRDIINVCHRTLHPEKAPLDMGSTYAALRESIHACELLIMRVLKFHMSFSHPHKYLLHYVKSLTEWLDPRINERVPIARTAWTILSDSYHGKVCLQHPPEYMAVAILYFATQCHGVEVPYTHDSDQQWYQALCEGISLQRIRQIISDIIDTYNLEVVA